MDNHKGAWPPAEESISLAFAAYTVANSPAYNHRASPGDEPRMEADEKQYITRVFIGWVIWLIVLAVTVYFWPGPLP